MSVAVPANLSVFALYMEMIGIDVVDVPYWWNVWCDTRSEDPREFEKYVNYVERNKEMS